MAGGTRSAGDVLHLRRLGERLGERRVLALLACAGVVLGGRVAKNLFPLSLYDMYAGPHQTSASRVVARDASGAAHPVTHYVSWACEQPVSPDPTQCKQFPFHYVPSEDWKRARWIGAHGGVGREPIDVVYRVWRIDAAGTRRDGDCLLAHCRAVRR